MYSNGPNVPIHCVKIKKNNNNNIVLSFFFIIILCLFITGIE